MTQITKEIMLEPRELTPWLSNCLYAMSVLVCNAKEERDCWLSSDVIADWIHNDYRNMVDAHRKLITRYNLKGTDERVSADFESKHTIISCKIDDLTPFTQIQKSKIEKLLDEASTDQFLVSSATNANGDRAFIYNTFYYDNQHKVYWAASLTEKACMLRERNLDVVMRSEKGEYKLGGLGWQMSDGGVVGGELALHFSLKPLKYVVTA